MLEPFGQVGAIFSLQLSSQTQLCKIKNKKFIPENQCEKQKIEFCSVLFSDSATSFGFLVPKSVKLYCCMGGDGDRGWG